MVLPIKRILKLSYVIILITFFACGEKQLKEEKVLRPVKYSEVKAFGGDKERRFSGTAQTEKIINLSFRSSGIVTKLDMKLGQMVKKGQLLGTLDNVSARLNYESAIESKNSSESQMNTARLALNRVRTLYEKGSASLSDYEDAKNSYRTAVASFESSKRSVAIQSDQIQFGYLYAPEDGAIASVSVELDENISPGQTIGVLNAGSEIEIKLGLPESVINSIQEGMDTKVSFPAIPEIYFNGIVTEISPALDSNSSTYPITVQIINSDERIKSGMVANVFFEFASDASSKTRVVVPNSAVGADANGHFVFLIEIEEGAAVVKKHSITIGESNENGIEVVNGLTIGEKIAVAGLQTLLDGQKVKLN